MSAGQPTEVNSREPTRDAISIAGVSYDAAEALRTSIAWSLSEAELTAAFGALGRKRALSMTPAGDANEHRYTLLWEESEEGAPEQRFQRAVSAASAERVVRRAKDEGFEPHLVAMTGSNRLMLAFVFQRTPVGAQPRTFAGTRPFRNADGTFFTSTLASHGAATWLAAAGSPANPSGDGVVVATIHAPRAAPRVGWAVHLHVLGNVAPNDLADLRFLASIARPVVLLRLAGRGAERYLLSLFRDERVARWADPFARAPNAFEVLTREGSIAVHDGARPLSREVHVVEHGDVPVDPGHPIDGWMLDRMRESGARHAQIAVVRGTKLAFARAYTFAEPGYPIATMNHALRLGSVSKAIVAVTFLRAIAEGEIPNGLDATLASLLGDGAIGRADLEATTVRDLLLHRSGLPSFADISPTETQNRLSEAHIVTLLGDRVRARPGDLSRAIRRMARVTLFDPERGRRHEPAYSNDGFTLLGELLADVLTGDPSRLDDVMCKLFRGAGVPADGRGTLAAATPDDARARGESPAHGSSPSVRLSLTDAANHDPAHGLRGLFVDLAYATNLRFHGAAVGLSVPVLWVARLFRRLDGTPAAPGQFSLHDALAPCIADVRAGARATYGFYAGEPGWFKARSARGWETFRTLRLHHNGRVEGGASLLMIQIPAEPRPEHPPLIVVAAMNQLGDLYEDPHGRELFGILRRLEESRDWPARDDFERDDHQRDTTPSEEAL